MPPEPNPDGSYTFSHQEIDTLRSSLPPEAQSLLPTPQQQDEHAQKFQAIEQKRRDEHEAAIQAQILEHQQRYYPQAEQTPPSTPLDGLLDFIVGTVQPKQEAPMQKIPELNLDGTYSFSPQEIANINSYFNALKDPTITPEGRREYIKEAQALLPSPELMALDKALIERQQKELQDLKDKSQIEKLQSEHKEELNRYRQEYAQSQKLLHDMEEKSRNRELTDEPDRPKRSL